MEFLRGTGVALVTPFDANGQVDATALRRVVDHQLAGGVEYLVALGTTGESATLTEDEQIKVVDIIVEQTAGRVPIVLGVGGNDTLRVAKKLKQFSQRFAPQAILSVSPYYNKPTQNGIIAHYKELSQHTDLPIILYNVPGRTSSNLSASTILELANEIPHVIAVKEAAGNLEQSMEIVAQKPDGFDLISGDDILTLPLIACGAVGVISVTANAFPATFSEMVRLALAGKIESARALHYRLLPLIQMNFWEGNPAGVKQSLALQDICSPQVRLPLVGASDHLVENLRHALKVFFEQEAKA